MEYDTESVQRLKDALGKAREKTEQPSILKQVLNKAKVAKRLADEYIAMRLVSDDVTKYNNTFKPLGAKGYDGTKLDKYYHSRGMYNAAQLGPDAAEFALKLGEIKEKYYDKLLKKYIWHWSDKKINEDTRKDLQNNINAVIMALENPGVPVSNVIPYKGTTPEVFDPRFAK